MKKSVFIFVLLCQFGLFAQNPDLFNRSWYVTEMQIDGEMVPIPDIPFDRPEGCVVGLRMYGANPYEEGIADLAICVACSADLSDITNTEFKSTGVACLVCMDCGPCNPNYSYPNCGMFSEFEGKQIGFFEVIYPEYELISYEIEDLGNDHLSLTLSKENGDYIIYGTEEVLAINEHSISQLAIYPNPSSDKFTLSYSGEIAGFQMYNLQGKKTGIQLDENLNADVSTLTPGIYFVSVSDVEGQISVKKFVKR